MFNVKQAFFPALLGHWKQQVKDRRRDLQELEVGVSQRLPKPMDLHYADLRKCNLNII